MLTLEDEKEDFNLFSEYKDVFTWSYKEIPRLDPKVVIHSLALRKRISPKKQP